MGNEVLQERLGKIETTLKGHERRLQIQESKNDSLTQLKTLVEIQTETNKEQNKQMEKFSETLSRINENLTHLNTNQQQSRTDMGKLTERVTEIENTLNESKIDPLKIATNVLFTVITGVIIFWFYKEFGIK